MTRDSEAICEVVRVTTIHIHPGADKLQLAKIESKDGPMAYELVIGSGSFRPGDLAVYCGVDCLVPKSEPEFAFLAQRKDGQDRPLYRLRAARLRGVYSEGLLVPIRPGMRLGDECWADLNVEYHRPPADEPRLPTPPSKGRRERYDICPQYQINSLLKTPWLFQPGEIVWVTEKIHGTNFRFGRVGGGLYVGSHRTIRSDWRGRWARLVDWVRRRRPALSGNATFYGEDVYRDVAEGCARFLDLPDDVVLYGEIYGKTRGGKNIQDMTYDQGGPRVRFFDAWSVKEKRWMRREELPESVQVLFVERRAVPYDLAWLQDLADQPSEIDPKTIREGVVVEGSDGRKAKLVGRVYKQRKVRDAA